MADDVDDVRALDFPDQPSLVLVGPPGRLRGEIHVRNPGTRKLVVRDPTVRTRAASLVALTGKANEATWHLRRVVLRPGQARRVPLALELDPRTPPGEYDVELDLVGVRQPFRLIVTEHADVSLEPDEIVIENRPGETIERTVVVTNLGNLPISVPKIGSIGLDDELGHCRALRATLKDDGDQIASLDELIKSLSKHYKALYDPLVLRIQNDSVTIAPGAMQSIALSLELPDELIPTARYLAVAPIATRSLHFTIVPS